MKKVIILIAALTSLASMAQAQKFAVVDMQKAAQSYWKTGAEERKLEEQQRRHQEFLRLTQEEINSILEERQSALDSSENIGLSDDARENYRQQAMQKETEALQKRNQAQMEQQRLQARAQEADRLISGDIRAAVSVVAKRNNIDVVYPTQVVAYAQTDLTDQVIQELNKSAPAQGATPAPAAQ